MWLYLRLTDTVKFCYMKYKSNEYFGQSTPQLNINRYMVLVKLRELCMECFIFFSQQLNNNSKFKVESNYSSFDYLEQSVDSDIKWNPCRRVVKYLP